MGSSIPSPITPQLVFGLFVMGLGIILGLDSLGIADAGYILRFWPTGLILLGVMIASRPEPHSRFWGFFWIIVGSWLLLRSVGVIRVGFWQLFWPTMLILVGGNIILKTLRHSGHLSSIENKGNERLFALMSENRRRYDGRPFDGAYMTAFMGGCVLDLRRAVVPTGETRVVEVFGIMVGHEIKAPSDWNVTLDVMPLMGDVKDKRVPSMTPPPLAGTPPTLVVRGSVVMGEVKITD